MISPTLLQRLDAEQLAFRTLTTVDKVVTVLAALSATAAAVQLLADLRGLTTGALHALRTATYGSFITENATLLLTLGITFALWLAIGRSTRRQALGDYRAHAWNAGDVNRLVDQIDRTDAPGERVDRYGACFGWTEPAANKALAAHDSNDDIAITVLPGKWLAYCDGNTIGDAGRLLMRHVIRAAIDRGGYVFNSDKVRLATDLFSGGRLAQSVAVQRTDYVSSMMTDSLAFKRIQCHSAGEEAPLHDGYTDFVTPGLSGTHRLRPLADTKSSNQIGVSVLAFTRDGHLLAVLQSGRAHHSQNCLAPSGSGSLDWADIDDGRSGLLAAARRGAVREMMEECGFEGEQAVPAIAAKVYAFARLLHRGGKPEFFAVGRIDATYAMLSTAKLTRFERIFSSNRQSLFGVPFDHRRPPRDELIAMCDGFFADDFLTASHAVRNRQATYSYQLQHGMRLLRDAIADDDSWPHLAPYIVPTAA